MKKWSWILLALLAGLIVFSCMVGRYELSLYDIVRIVLQKSENKMDRTLFFQVRLSRTILVVLAGCFLSLAGMTYQTIFQNPLVSPDVLGVSSGCSVGAAITILYFPSAGILGQGLTFCFGIGTVILAVELARLFGGDRRYRMILAGIVIGALSNSILMAFKYTADPNRELPVIEYWLMGSFQNAGWRQVRDTAVICIPTALILFCLRWRIKILTLGEEEAQGLGVSVSYLQRAAIICATIFVSAVVSIAGTVAWIGLIAPHIVRAFLGDDYEKNWMPTFFMGGILLLAADILARTLFPAEIPISIWTSFFGAAVLMLLLWRARKEADSYET